MEVSGQSLSWKVQLSRHLGDLRQSRVNLLSSRVRGQTPLLSFTVDRYEEGLREAIPYRVSGSVAQSCPRCFVVAPGREERRNAVFWTERESVADSDEREIQVVTDGPSHRETLVDQRYFHAGALHRIGLISRL